MPHGMLTGAVFCSPKDTTREESAPGQPAEEFPAVEIPEAEPARDPDFSKSQAGNVDGDQDTIVPADTRKPVATVASDYPEEVQTDIAINTKPNRNRIQARVDSLLTKYNQQAVPIRRMSLHGDIVIRSPLPDMPFWGYRASGILPQHLMDGVMTAMADAEAAGCQPHIDPLKKAQAKARKRERMGLPPLPVGGSRSDYEVPFHIGVFKHPTPLYDRPWITKDTLQGTSGDTKVRKEKIDKMMTFCKSLDNLVNGRLQRLIRHKSPETYKKFQAYARLRHSTSNIIRHDFDQKDLPAELDKYSADKWPFLRFGNLGSAVAIGRGQSEKLHLDVNDDKELPTILMVLGSPDNDWDHSQGQGDILLPTLGLSVPLFPGDVFIFYASLLPHQVKLLPEDERHKRTVATLFTCAPTRKHLEKVAAEEAAAGQAADGIGKAASTGEMTEAASTGKKRKRAGK